MKTGFLIINYNDFETTTKLINNIKNYKIIDKIVVVDNNSTDNSYELLQNLKSKKIDIIKSISNKGYGSGINFGSKYLINKIGPCYIIVSNPDIIIKKENDIKKLIDSFDDETSIVAPIVNEHGLLNRGWKVPSPIQDVALNLIYVNRLLRPKLLFYNERYYNNDLVNVDAVSGCFFIIKSSDLEQVDFFDENIFLYYEENIIAKKLKKINKKIKININVEIIHNHSVTIDKSIKRINKYKELKKSQMYFQRVYNSANLFEIFLLYTTNKITLGLLHIINFFR